MFYGENPVAMDAKQRFALPASYRPEMEDLCARSVVLTEGLEGQLLLLPEPKWQTFAAQFTNAPLMNQWLKRIFLNSAVQTQFDGAWRLLISASLRQAAHIENDLLLVGSGEYFELWEPIRYRARKEQEKLAYQAAQEQARLQAMQASVTQATHYLL